MQPKKSTILDFTRRTDALAARLRIRVGDLPATLGMSRASLFNYRSGKTRITDKARRKLERAERQAGVSKSLLDQLRRQGADTTKLIQSASISEIMELLPENSRGSLLRKACELQIDAAEVQLRGFYLDAEALAQLVKSRKQSDRRQVPFFADKIRSSFRKSTAAWEFLARELRRALDLEPTMLLEKSRATRRKTKS